MPKGKKLSDKQVEQRMETYTEASVESMLKDAFGQWEKRIDTRYNLPFLDSADHIIIGGRTVTEMLVERFNKRFPKMKVANKKRFEETQRVEAYGIFREKEGKRLIKRLVANAIASGENVEIYLPDKQTGRISEPPRRVSGRGYDLTKVNPARMNGWQKFWSKLGFYKQEKAAAMKYENYVKSVNAKAAREKVRFCNKASCAYLNTSVGMGGNYLAEMDKFQPKLRADMAQDFPECKGDPTQMGEMNGFRTTRGSFFSLITCIVATKRDGDGKLMYSNEQLFDMKDPEMQEARANAAKELYDHYKVGGKLKAEEKKVEESEKKAAKGEKVEIYTMNPEVVEEARKAREWLADLQVDASYVLQDRMAEQAKKIDFGKPDLTEQEGYREFAMLSDAAFDQSQDMSKNQGIIDKYGKEGFDDAAERVGLSSQVYRQMQESMRSQKMLANGIAGTDRSAVCLQLAKVFRAQFTRQYVHKEKLKKPGKPINEIIDFDVVSNTGCVYRNALIEDDVLQAHQNEGAPLPDTMDKSMRLAAEMKSAPEKFSQQITSGVLDRRFELTGYDFKKDDPAKFEIKDAATVEREMQQEKQSQEKQSQEKQSQEKQKPDGEPELT